MRWSIFFRAHRRNQSESDSLGATAWHVPEPHDLEADQDSYQRGLQEGRAARALSRELGIEPDSEPDPEPLAGSRGQRQAYLRGYRAGLND
jgi:hypothetical protein